MTRTAAEVAPDRELLVGSLPAPAGRPERESAGTALVRLALAQYRLAVSTDDEPFAVPVLGPPIVRPLRGGKGSLRAALADAYFTAAGKVAPQQALTEALLTLEGRAQQQNAERLHLRVADHAGVHYLDLGDPTGRAVAVSAAGWQVVAAVPVLFRRTQLTGALPVPASDGTLEELWGLLNVAHADRPLVLAWLVAALLPDVPHPVLALRGEQGVGKSTATRTLAGLLDPSPAQVRKPPREVDAWVTAASGSWVVAVDNVSTVAAWWSDALCRSVTGDGDVRRRLYSDADLTVFSFRRVVLLNGIDLGAVRDDLAERLLTVELRRIGEHGRRLDADLAAQWAQAHPRILGAVLDLAVKVLAVLPDLRLDRLPRMADFARVLAAVDRVLGTAGLAAYVGQAGDLAADAVDSDAVLSAIAETVRELWVGTAAELLERITPDADDRRRMPKDWPKDARTLTGLLRRRGPSLRRVGWELEDLGRGGKAMVVRFRLAPPQASDRQATADQAGDVACLTGDVDARRMPIAGPVTCENTENRPEAGDAGVRNACHPPWSSKKKREPPRPTGVVDPDTEGTFSSPASPAELGRCVRACGRIVVRYGPRADPICRTCRSAMRAAS